MTTNQFRARVELEAKKRGWSIAKVARQINKSPQTFQDILKRGNPRIETATQLATLFDMTIEAFLKPITSEEYGAVHMPKFDN